MSDGPTNYVPSAGQYVMGNKNKLKICAVYQNTGSCPLQYSKERPCTEAHSIDEQRRHGHIRASQDLPEEEAEAFPKKHAGVFGLLGD